MFHSILHISLTFMEHFTHVFHSFRKINKKNELQKRNAQRYTFITFTYNGGAHTTKEFADQNRFEMECECLYSRMRENHHSKNNNKPKATPVRDFYIYSFSSCKSGRRTAVSVLSYFMHTRTHTLPIYMYTHSIPMCAVDCVRSGETFIVKYSYKY